MASRRKSLHKSPPWGLTLTEFRGHWRAVMRSGWYVLFSQDEPRTRAQRRHAATVAVATIVFPVAWHHAHEGRLSDAYYRQRQDWLRIWRPFYRKPIEGRHPEAR